VDYCRTNGKASRIEAPKQTRFITVVLRIEGLSSSGGRTLSEMCRLNCSTVPKCLRQNDQPVRTTLCSLCIKVERGSFEFQPEVPEVVEISSSLNVTLHIENFNKSSNVLVLSCCKSLLVLERTPDGKC